MLGNQHPSKDEESLSLASEVFPGVPPGVLFEPGVLAWHAP